MRPKFVCHLSFDDGKMVGADPRERQHFNLRKKKLKLIYEKPQPSFTFSKNFEVPAKIRRTSIAKDGYRWPLKTLKAQDSNKTALATGVDSGEQESLIRGTHELESGGTLGVRKTLQGRE